MKYFEILEDLRVQYRYKIESLEWTQIEEESIGIVNFQGEEDMVPDFIVYKKQYLISAEFKKIIEMYTDEVSFKLVMFNNIKAQVQKEYYCVEPLVIEGLGGSSTYNKDNSVNKKVLSFTKVKDYKVFGLKELHLTQFSRPHIFVDLDIVESVLRRDLWGMVFEELSVED
ncbi:hypothetical protein B0P06_004276 [Clostridium saccharoperbutylacetonicum]|uniref:Uncharacterized protein n=1 Tax=Clostridium saccharoperbutylacetonicum N1-4(HMT) TaxID=931276 RepID=M1LW61_9CLOT|nr:hypothetical protein [Clostridium saccharoperbutylacetonicum]AGF57425.1 hypothetical protein Cspa_c36650 [Clostridium saccharoperbutylacetonicum N1-4(HMT)]NRT61809.1 hypothetical protein [Clostridium saccharoperbutylacetonicum]NSB25134.1 hypothetical protein [Clostridium saccharoperbutylacetonicum]NSB44505.1 hypothetical protein [Clostridium saccharoperbutylacetonicum]